MTDCADKLMEDVQKQMDAENSSEFYTTKS